ncbi:DUF3997 domain-containing protein [Planctomicrobium piriforme]|uniref:DUF3997 domain-containing protein n=1 Tax=Planctomicrobium piriforme TaxID=1576369 RepID=A0A1I3SFJ8_9PLAN|nr:DUF3997 domain-containing protein [Planctomicrobium piriforme]SFJ57120.1 Protein of unknown function [Planctomicrobium piriforme]
MDAGSRLHAHDLLARHGAWHTAITKRINIDMRSIFAALIILVGMSCQSCFLESFGPGPRDFTVPLPKNYFIYCMSADRIFIAPKSWGESTPIIPPKVVEVGFDDRFLIAKQLELTQSDYKTPPTVVAQQYWILDFGRPEVVGPLTAESFTAERQRLGVSPDLELRNVFEYKQ